MKDPKTMAKTRTVALNSPADAHPPPPVTTLDQVLPFGALTPENFERLCFRLAGGAEDVEHFQLYGRPGQKQHGIDLFVRLPSGRYRAWQVKRYAKFSVADLKRVLKTFDEGSWADRCEALIIAIQANLDDTGLQEAIEVQAAAYRTRNIKLQVLGGEELSDRLRQHERLVHDFFGRPWSEAFFGASSKLIASLDGQEFARVREQIRRAYATQFAILDQGLTAPLLFADLTKRSQVQLTDQYVLPDVLRREISTAQTEPPRPTSSDDAIDGGGREPRTTATARERERRVGLSSWAMESSRLALVGDAGLGKSTFLRALALDLLGSQTLFPHLAEKWGERLPIVLPFARWARAAAAAGGHVSLKEMVKLVWQPLLTADLGLIDRAIDEQRILLLLDGLDEWSNEQAARTTLNTVLTFVGAHDLPVVMTGRPRGLQKIGGLPVDWSIGELAPLSLPQRHTLATNRFTQSLTVRSGDVPAEAAVEMEVERFFQGLKLQPGLYELSETPLLLVGLIGLALRNHVLPRTRTQALARLVETLIEEHPERRATAAGDTEARFTVLRDADVRRSVLAAMALASREHGGDAGLEQSVLKGVVVDFLTTVEGFPMTEARRGADELLAINAETVGLLIEKAPGEIGFAHASLEEYLAAVALSKRPFADLTQLFVDRCGEPRWLNVLGDLACQMHRADELDGVVNALETAALDPESAYSRDHLVAYIAFNAQHLRAATASRLAKAGFDQIEAGGWMNSRQRLLRTALSGPSRQTLAGEMEQRDQHWRPKRARYLTGCLDQLATMPPTEDVFTVLLSILNQERLSERLQAAHILASCYAEWPGLIPELKSRIGRNLDFVSAASALMAWIKAAPQDPDAISLAESATESNSDLLVAIGLFARIRRGVHTLEDRGRLIELGETVANMENEAQTIIFEAVTEGWPDDQALISLALDILHNKSGSIFQRDFALNYIKSAPPRHPKIIDWLVEEFNGKYPLNISFTRDWTWVIPFARNQPALVDSILGALMRDEHGMLGPTAWRLIAELGDDRMRDLAIQRVRRGNRIDAYWGLLPLVRGWSDDTEVKALLEEIAGWPLDRQVDVLWLLPFAITDPVSLRARLFEMAALKPQGFRFDALTEAFREAGSDWQDEEVVSLLFKVAEEDKSGIFSPLRGLIEGFGAHLAVRELSLRALTWPDPPIHALMAAYAEDVEFRPRLLNFARSLPIELRSTLVQTALVEGDQTPFSARALADYSQEVDLELRTALALGYYEGLVAKNAVTPEIIESLRRDANSVGPEYETWRATALAGLIATKRVDVLRDDGAAGKSLSLSLGGYFDDSPTQRQLICEHWEYLQTTFGDGLVERFGRMTDNPAALWEALAPSVAASNACTRAFLAYCEKPNIQLGEAGLRALANLKPRSSLLEALCFAAMGQQSQYSDLDHAKIRVASAQILAEQFPGRDDITTRLVGGHLYPRLSNQRILALALYAPDAEALQSISIEEADLREGGLDWPTLMHLVSQSRDASQFVRVLNAYLNRQRPSPWDLAAATNTAVIARLRRDEMAAAAFSEIILKPLTPFATLGSGPRLLAAAGRITPKVRLHCQEALRSELTGSGLPCVVYDTVEDRQRNLSHCLLDFVGA